MRRGILALFLLGALGLPRAAAAPAPPPPPVPAPPAAPVSGEGAPTRRFERVERGVFPNPIDGDFEVHWFRPQGVAENAPLPVVVFLHGFGAPGPTPYLAWLEHLAAQGQVVLYPVYPAIEARAARTRYDAMWAGAWAGLHEGLPRPGAQPDATRLGFIGHSYGGGAAPALAARAAARGLGAASLWLLCLAPWYDLDQGAWGALPSRTLLVAVAYEDDRVCDPAIAATFPERATTIPDERKAFRCLRSDAHGSPALEAGHLTPLTFRGIDAYDVRGTWALADALRAGAEGEAKALALAMGQGEGALDLGQWSDGVPVRAPLCAWEPSSEGAAKRRQWRAGGQQEDLMRRMLRPEGFSTLPLPAASEARASSLPPSERFLAPPPPGPWPPAVAEALRAGPVLVVSEAGVATEALTRLEASGARLVRLPATDATPTGKAFAEAQTPSALLLLGDGTPRLWRRADDPRLAEAVADLLAPR